MLPILMKKERIYSQPSVLLRSESSDSTNHWLKIFVGKKILESFKKQGLSFPRT